MTPSHLDKWEKFYRPANRLIWRGRVDSTEPMRLHEIMRCIDLLEHPDIEVGNRTFGLLGFACDEGVRRNLGHVGAAAGPDVVKGAMANLPIGPSRELLLYDFGSVACYDDDLESAQEALGMVVELLLNKGVRPVVIGGGHETSWGHYQGIRRVFPNERIGIINFDAHFDLRPLSEEGLGNSGTSFLQIADWCRENNQPFDYTVIGVQSVSNTSALFDEAEKLGVNYVLAEEINAGRTGVAERAIEATLERNERVYVTLCMDAIASAFAPGVSAPQPFGLDPRAIVPLMRQINKSDKTISLDLCELCPPRDRDNCTAQLAAAFLGIYLETDIN